MQKLNLNKNIIKVIKKIRLLCLDVDGVMTDGGVYYCDNGTISRKYNIQDGYGIKEILDLGYHVAVITMSTEKNIEMRVKSLKIQHYFCGIKDKLNVVKELSKMLNLKMSQVAFLGDDLNDIHAMKCVGLPISVLNAVKEVKKVTLFTTTLPGGTGAIRQVCDIIKRYGGHKN